MIFPSNRVRIMVATKPIDFSKGHNSPTEMVRNELCKDPFTGTVYVFRAKKADRLKLLYWDGTGLVMAYKRLEEHSFTGPAAKDGFILMNHAQFELALEDLETAMAVIHAEEDAEDRAAKRPAKPRPVNRGSLPKHLPRIEEVIEPDSLICACGGCLHCIGEDVSELLDIVPI